MSSFIVNNILSEEDFLYLKQYVYNHMDNSDDFTYAEWYGRYWNVMDLDDRLYNVLKEKAVYHSGIDNLDIAYVQCVKYKKEGDCIPSLKWHIDKMYSDYVMDITIESTINWPLKVDQTEYPCVENSAIFMQGDKIWHGRPDYPGGDEDYVILIFVWLMRSDSEMMQKISSFNSLPDNVKKLMKKKMISTAGWNMKGYE